MLSTLRGLVAHKGHANASLLKVVIQSEAAAADPEILDLLHHILVANRFWCCAIRGVPFVQDQEMSTARSPEALAEAYGRTQEEETAWPGGRCSVAEALLQVCMHSHGHRAQIARLIRRHGVAPPQADFILWLAGRPEAEWGGGASGQRNEKGDRRSDPPSQTGRRNP